MRLFYSLSLLALFCVPAAAQNLNTTLRSKMTFNGQTLANVWGYAADDREYALVGGSQGLIIIDITDPDNPQQIVQIPGPNNLWKEIKTYSHYAYLVSEGGQGVQIVDLSKLPSPNLDYKSYYGDGAINNQLNKGHALHIDTAKAFLYVYGSNLFGGAPVVLSLKDDPYNPVYAGKFNLLGYVHDGYADNDTMYSSHIYAGQFAIVDMTDKANPKLIATQTTPGAFTHNTWISQDRRTLFTTDEVTNSVLAAYDISDPTDIRLLDQIRSNPGSNSIVHNTHILGDFAVTAWYRDGFTIVDVSRPDNLVQVGNYDTYAGSGNGFQGCWGVYPYFPSGTVIASNISAAGSNNTGELFIISPNYVRACYLEGRVTNAVNGQPINNANIVITASNPLTQDQSNALGEFKMGQLQDGFYYATISRTGFQTAEVPVLLENGKVFELNVQLYPEGSLTVSGTVVRYDDKSPVPFAEIKLFGLTQIIEATADADGVFSIPDVPPGEYDCSAEASGYGMTMLSGQKIVANQNLSFELIKGHRRTGPGLPGVSANDQSLQTWPNPFQTHINIRQPGAQIPIRIVITDVTGKTVYGDLVVDPGAEISIGANWPPGAYLAQIWLNNQWKETRKLIKLP